MRSVISFFRRFWLPIALVLGIALIAAAFFLGRQSVYQSHPELSNQEQAQVILEKVGKLIQLPQGEFPQMATIEDAESVRAAQPFLREATNGDILIVYGQAQIALLYRPSENKLIAVGPVSADTSAPIVEEEPEVIEEDNATTTDN